MTLIDYSTNHKKVQQAIEDMIIDCTKYSKQPRLEYLNTTVYVPPNVDLAIISYLQSFPMLRAKWGYCQTQKMCITSKESRPKLFITTTIPNNVV